MKKNLTIPILAAVVIVVGAWFLMQSGSSVEYVASVDSEITELEADLAELDAKVEAGTLTPEQAAEAQIRIAARMETISTAISGSSSVTLDQARQAMLMKGLERIKLVLIRYQGTLEAVDASVATLPAAERPKLTVNSGSGRGAQKIVDLVAETAGEVEDHIEDVVEDYDPETTVEDVIEELEEPSDTTETEADVEAGASDEVSEAETDTEVSADEGVDGSNQDPVTESETGGGETETTQTDNTEETDGADADVEVNASTTISS